MNFIAISKFHRRGEHCSPALAAAATPKIFPCTVAGLQCRPLQAIGKAYAKILPLFQNFIVGASIARPLLPQLQPKKYPPHRCGPAVQAPTSNRQGLCKNSTALSKFHRRGEHCSPALAAAATPKIFPCTVAGLQCRPLQAIGKAYAKILSLFQNFIVGAGLGSARLCRSCKPKKYPPRTVGGPAMQAPTSKRQGLCKNSIALLQFHGRGEHCSPALAVPTALKKSPPHPVTPPCPRTQNAHFAAKMKIP